MSVSAEVLADLVSRAHDGAARLGAGRPAGPGVPVGPGCRLVVVDGPAGSGKTTLAAQLGEALPAQVVHMDDLYEGWTGMTAGTGRLVEQVLGPLSQGRPGCYQRYDWTLGDFAEWHDVPLAPFLVVEGCGAGARRIADLTTLLVWVEADDEIRLARGIARDGDDAYDAWIDWMVSEREVYAVEGTAERADVVLDGFGEPVLRPDRAAGGVADV
ncbi:uridine kinase family protein [Oerskovia merdavium]|uniref:Uridine kinase n=1 Tax=Oerskovia merdavium TaxID=2762227 RepID=A0ABR8U0B6_9CELL|nr:uridine kinase [Oerskovia merdavium]MBD7981476.1 uridine kinase [Oerskovia merdavium]